MTAPAADRPATVTRCAVCRKVTAGTRTCPTCRRRQPELPFDGDPAAAPKPRPARRLRAVRPTREG